MTLFEHLPHPRTRQHLLPTGNALPIIDPPTHERVASRSERAGLKITALVGTMACALVFTVIALVSLPAALSSGSTVVIVGWIAQTFLQLVLLSIIMVGQNVQAKASDARAEATFVDAEAVLHECLELQRHLHAQDKLLLAHETSQRQPETSQRQPEG